MNAHRYRAFVPVPVELQTNLRDDRNRALHFSLSFDRDIPRAAYVDGSQLLVERNAGLEFLLVFPNLASMVEFVFLIARADEFVLVGDDKTPIGDFSADRDDSGKLRVSRAL